MQIWSSRSPCWWNPPVASHCLQETMQHGPLFLVPSCFAVAFLPLPLHAPFALSNSEKLLVSQAHHALFHMSTWLPHNFLFALECPSWISLHPSSPGLFSVFYLFFKFQLKEEVTFQRSLPHIPHRMSVPFCAPDWVHHTRHTLLLTLSSVLVTCCAPDWSPWERTCQSPFSIPCP